MRTKDLAIFGVGKTAMYCKEIAEDMGLRVVSHFVEADYLEEAKQTLDEVVSLEEFISSFGDADIDVCVAIGYHELNKTRQRISSMLTGHGFRLRALISPKAHISTSAEIGSGCVIGPFADIQHGASIGTGSFVWSGSVVGHGSKLGDYCWLASNVTIGGDSIIGDKSFLGLGSIVSNDLIIGEEVFAGAQSLLAENISSRSAVLASRVEPLKNMSEKILAIWGDLT